MIGKRTFMIAGEEVTISNDLIKEYYAYPQCYVKEDDELYRYNGKIYVSENGEICNGINCSIQVPSQILDENGSQISAGDIDLEQHSSPGFIYENTLHFLENLVEIA